MERAAVIREIRRTGDSREFGSDLSLYDHLTESGLPTRRDPALLEAVTRLDSLDEHWLEDIYPVWKAKEPIRIRRSARRALRELAKKGETIQTSDTLNLTRPKWREDFRRRMGHSW